MQDDLKGSPESAVDKVTDIAKDAVDKVADIAKDAMDKVTGLAKGEGAADKAAEQDDDLHGSDTVGTEPTHGEAVDSSDVHGDSTTDRRVGPSNG